MEIEKSKVPEGESGAVEEWVDFCKQLLEEVNRMRKGIRVLIEKVDDRGSDFGYWLENELEEILEPEEEVKLLRIDFEGGG